MQRVLPRRPFKKLEITENTGWAKEFWNKLIPLKDKVVSHPLFKDVSEGKLPIAKCKRALIDFYPLVENFPKYMALNLSKTKRNTPGHLEAKYWLIQNIKVEQNHADWWHSWAEGFGVSDEQLALAEPSPMMDSINNFLWSVNMNYSLPEGIAATNLAIEWATGEWTINILEGIKSYSKTGEVKIDEKVMSWLNAHATYDDEHPDEAMEVIKLTAINDELREKSLKVAQRSLEYYILALDDCYADVKELSLIA